MEEQEVHVGPMWYDYEVKDKMGEFIKANPYFSDQDSILRKIVFFVSTFPIKHAYDWLKSI